MNLSLHLSTMFENGLVQEAFEAELIKSLNVISFNGQRKIFAVGQYGNAITLKFNAFRGSPREHYKLSVGKVGEAVLDKVENPFQAHIDNERNIGK